jgi:hypothetical protein
MKADYKERLKIVLQVLQPLQFSKALIIRTVRNLLNVRFLSLWPLGLLYNHIFGYLVSIYRPNFNYLYE